MSERVKGPIFFRHELPDICRPGCGGWDGSVRVRVHVHRRVGRHVSLLVAVVVGAKHVRGRVLGRVLPPGGYHDNIILARRPVDSHHSHTLPAHEIFLGEN